MVSVSFPILIPQFENGTVSDRRIGVLEQGMCSIVIRETLPKGDLNPIVFCDRVDVQ
jgi:hypothetical protein